MGGSNSDKSVFAEIVKKAYEKGTNDGAITVQKLIDEIKNDLKKMNGVGVRHHPDNFRIKEGIKAL